MINTNDNLRWLVEEFSSSFALALQGLLGERPLVTTASALDGSGHTCWRQPFSTGGAYVSAPEEAWRRIGARALAAAGVDHADEAAVKSTFGDVLSHTFAALAHAISKRANTEITCGRLDESTPPRSDVDWLGVAVTFGSEDPVRVRISFEPGLIPDALSRLGPGTEHTTETALTTAGEQSQDGAAAMDLLLDVELPVSVSFGRAQLPLKEVIKLTTGSIVELNRTIGEPVEVIVNNCVIARGEVVVVDGNFGVRIQQVISRKERLRTLY
jgi:flagellar motor switch protein FliN/FliY